MFKRKKPRVLLLTREDASYPDYRVATYEEVGPEKIRLVQRGANGALILHDDGTVAGDYLLARWIPLS
jgi:hypothetical protein